MTRTILYPLYLTMLLSVSYSGFSQLRVGFTGGGAVSSVLFSSRVQIDQALVAHADIQKPVNTYYGGLVFPLKAGKRFVIRPGIIYFRKAWEVQANNRGRISTFRLLRKYNIDYVQVPVQILLTTPMAHGRIYIGAGAYAACAIKGNVHADNETFDLEFKKFNEQAVAYLPGESYKPVQFISRYTVNRIDCGLSGTLGYEFELGLFLEAGVDIGTRQVCTSYERYDLSLSRTIKDPGSSVKYSVFHIGVGWMLDFK